MTEKVLHEVRFIETDDGFRIEVKGDKELIKKMGFGPGMMGFGPRHHFGGQWRRHRPHGRHRKFIFGHGAGPWSWWDQWEDEPEEDVTEKSA